MSRTACSCAPAYRSRRPPRARWRLGCLECSSNRKSGMRLEEAGRRPGCWLDSPNHPAVIMLERVDA